MNPMQLAREGAPALYALHGERVPEVKRIAVLRANAVGDFVLAVPALWALRRSYPRATITLLGRPWHADFLNHRPSPVDEVVALPPGALEGTGNGTAQACIDMLRERRYDIAMQLHGGGAQSNPFIRALQPRVSAGLQAPGAPPLDRNLPYRPLTPEVLRLLEAVALVGARGCDIEPRLAVTEADRAEAAAAVPLGDAPLLVMQPACSDPRRAWPAERYAAVADHFAARGAQVVLNGTAHEALALRRVREAMRQPALDLAGTLSLGGLLGLLERARLLIGNDTGTAHLARSVGLASVTIFWIGNLCGYAPMSTARHATVVSWRTECPRCGQRNIRFRCEHQDSFVDEVGLDEVLQSAEELWRETRLDASPCVRLGPHAGNG